MTKRHAAKALFMQVCPQKKIAEVLETSEMNISRWKKEERWAEKRAESMLRQETASDRIWRLINHNLKVLNAQVEEMEASGELKLLNRGDIDGLYKLFHAVKGQQENWTHYVRVVKDFVAFMEMEDIHLSKEVVPMADKFLNTKRKELTA
jgi:transcriptional regulator